MVSAEQATIPRQTLRGETREQEQDRHMYCDSLGLRCLQLLLVLFQELVVETLGAASWLEEVVCPWGRLSCTTLRPACFLCFLAHHDVNLPAPLSETVHPNKAFLCFRISHRDRNETKEWRCFYQNVRSGRVFESNWQQSTLEFLTGKFAVTICPPAFLALPHPYPTPLLPVSAILKTAPGSHLLFPVSQGRG